MREQPTEILVDTEKLNCVSEEECCEKLRSIAEQDAEQNIYAIVRKREEIKAVYRAAVYGEISLLLGNVFNKENAETAKVAANLAFRELLEENHEFNGFIRKGIFIDTPLALLSHIPTEGFDFFCYDAEKLSLLLAEQKKTVHTHRKVLDTVIEKNINNSLPIQIIQSKIKIDQGIWVFGERL